MDKKKALIIGTVILLGGVGAYFFIQMRKKKKYEVIDFGETSQPTESSKASTTSFNAEPYAKKLQLAMKGWGTDEDAIWNTMGGLTNDQRKKVEAQFNKQFGDGSTLKQWFEGDLEGKDLERALAYLN